MQQNVIDSTTKALKRWGVCDMEHDGAFDPQTEEIIEMGYKFDPAYRYTWNEDTQTFDQGPEKNEKSRNTIMHEIFMTAEPMEQMPRLQAAIRKYTDLLVGLDLKNYTFARGVMSQALAAGDITQADYDLMDGIIPGG